MPADNSNYLGVTISPENFKLKRIKQKSGKFICAFSFGGLRIKMN